MTKRRMLAMIIALVICVSLSACSGEDQSSKFGTFIVIEQGSLENNLYQYIMYDPDTMVMYTYISKGYDDGVVFNVMYNADGTLKLYSPDTEAE